MVGRPTDRRPVGRALNRALAAAGDLDPVLVHDAALGPLGMLASDIGGLFHTPPAVLIVLTLLYPMLLAWSAAVVIGAGKSRATSPRPTQ